MRKASLLLVFYYGAVLSLRQSKKPALPPRKTKPFS